jgi:hypothetical protein
MRHRRYGPLGLSLIVSGASILGASLLLLRSEAGASTGIALLVLGGVLVVLEDSRPRVSPELSLLLMRAGYDNLARLLEELGLRARAVYLPSSLCHGTPRALIPLDVTGASLGGIGPVEERLVTRFGNGSGDVGLLVSTPGSGVLRLLPGPVGPSMDELGAAMTALVAGTLDIASSIVVHEEAGHLWISYRGVRAMDERSAWALERTVGSPLGAIAASLVAESKNCPVVIESELWDKDMHTVELRVVTK